MQLKAQRYLAMVATTGSFSATARHFRVPSSSVSRFIAALEREAGQQLLYRNTRGVKLTEAGERYYSQIRTVLELLDAADEELAGNAGKIRGIVRINAPATFGRLHFGKLITELRSVYPELIIELTLTDELIDPIKEGADIIFRISHLESSGLIGRRICEQRYVLCASHGYLSRHTEPRHPEQLRDHVCLVHSGNGGAERWFFRDTGSTAAIGVDVTGPIRSNNSELLLHAASAGEGIVLVPSWLLHGKNVETELKVLMPDFGGALSTVPAQMYLISPENRLRSHKVRAVWDFLLKAIGSPPYWDQ
ncbi:MULTISPECIES: LysR family transcriptional regulator [Pseudomonas]|uniref:LysR family transcriptional regulator n=1 Tax=Pseudomonas TaxID=286 RepID=UPI000571BECF|nr:MULTISPECIES: LysR family transcriptional regulator [Pseudomonas]MBP2839346.1 LysR family transcriptional regulator [Pseudomonas sp. PNP]MCK2122745.1 LysR family transcriptional regulator [Pseudomonas sp. PNPG3]QUN65205.1 LysR family transcriptional regulator [Pseudomonas sp. JS425]